MTDLGVKWNQLAQFTTRMLNLIILAFLVPKISTFIRTEWRTSIRVQFWSWPIIFIFYADMLENGYTLCSNGNGCKNCYIRKSNIAKPICYYRKIDNFFDCPGPGLLVLFITVWTEDHIDHMNLIKFKLFAYLNEKKRTKKNRIAKVIEISKWENDWVPNTYQLSNGIKM